MAATFVISRSRVFGRVRGLNKFSSYQSTFSSTRKKQSNAAFLLGFGLAGLVGFSGILFHGKKQRKRITATSFEKHSLAEEHYSSQSSSNVEEINRSCSPWTLQSAIEESQSIIRCMKEETGSPGVCVAVSIDGKTVWSEGFGFADVENRVLCSSKTVMRIASISKPLTATAAAKLWEDGKLDLDVPIQKYVASFPEKTFRGTPVTLTTRHLLSHLGGIRDYKRNKSSNEESKTVNQSEGKISNASKEQVMASTDISNSDTVGKSCTCIQQTYSPEEFYIKDHYDTVTEAISIFKDDPLLSDPGTSYLYTTHGWTLLSAVIEGASGEDFLLFMKKLFKELGMENTCAEFNDRIIYNRARFYQRNNQGHLVNAPYVDNSHKWGGGGFMSSVEDLVQFGNSMLYAKQMSCVNKGNFGSTGYLPGFLRPETVSEFWRIVTNTEGKGHKDGGYGLGWIVIPEKQDFGSCYHQSETVLHDGAGVGASSILLIRPHHVDNKPPKGVVVVLLVNLQRVNLEKTAMDVAFCFEKTKL